jgi:hypothetical protein
MKTKVYSAFPGVGKTTYFNTTEKNELSRRDCWFNSDESKEIGLIDNIIGLEKDKSITNYLEGFEEYYAKEVFKS